MKLIVDRVPDSCSNCLFCINKTCGLNINKGTEEINIYKDRFFNCPLENFVMEHYRHSH